MAALFSAYPRTPRLEHDPLHNLARLPELMHDAIAG